MLSLTKRDHLIVKNDHLKEKYQHLAIGCFKLTFGVVILH